MEEDHIGGSRTLIFDHQRSDVVFQVCLSVLYV